APTGIDERPFPLHDLPETIVIDVAANAVLVLAIARRGKHLELHALENVARVFAERVERYWALLTSVTADEERLILVEVPRSNLAAERDTLQLPLVILRARLDPLPRVEMDAQTPRIPTLPIGERRHDSRRRLEDATALLVTPVDRHDHDLGRREERRDTQS